MARTGIRRPLERLIARHWEIALYGAVVGVALALRLWDLDARGFQHDESRHVYYAWRLFRLDAESGHAAYEHMPSLHGPFQYFGTALIFRLFGDSDFTARLLYALFGTAMVALPWLLRDALGRVGALLAALLLALSPTLLYFSRFARDDIITAFSTLALAIALWRYLSDRRPAYLLVAAAALMLGLITKEVAFASTAILLLYLDWRLAGDLVTGIRSSRSLDPWQEALAWLILLPVAWLIAALWPLLGTLRRRWSLATLPAAGDLIVLIGTLLVLPLSPLVQWLPFIDDRGFYQDVPGGENALFWGTLIPVACVSAVIGLLWNRRVWPVAAAIVFLPYVSLYTSGFTNMAGFKSGIWGSLDLWMRLQLGAGSNQLQYYYLMFAAAYEFLPVTFALGGALYYGYRGALRQQLLASGTLTGVALLLILPGGDWRIEISFALLIVAVLLLSIDQFTKFLLFWTLLTLLSLTLAHEKAPWLAVHLAVPLALLAAKVLDGTFAGARELVANQSLTAGWSAAGRLAAAALFALLFAFTVRSAFVAAYDQGDPEGSPPELFIYLQATPGLVEIRDEITHLTPDATPCGRVTIALDSAAFWPWPWYLRDYDYEVFNAQTGVSAPPGAVILVSAFNQPAIEPYLSGYREGIVYRHAWWFPESYRGLHAANFLRDMLRGGYLDTWRDYFVHRRVTGAETAPDVIAYFPRQDAAPPDCAPPSPAPAPLDADATAFVAWARANRPSALPADGATILHLPSADIFAQDFERIAVALVSSSAREPTCRAAREASRAAWAAYLRRTAVNSPGARLEPIQEGRGGDIDIATSIVLAACDWRESLPAPP